MTTTQTCHFHETLRLCSEMHHLSCMTYHFYANHNGIAAQTDTRHVHEKSLFGALPNGRAIGAGFEHLRTVANTKTTTGEHSSTLRLPKLNENPSLRIREKSWSILELFLNKQEPPKATAENYHTSIDRCSSWFDPRRPFHSCIYSGSNALQRFVYMNQNKLPCPLPWISMQS